MNPVIFVLLLVLFLLVSLQVEIDREGGISIEEIRGKVSTAAPSELREMMKR